VFVFYIDTKKVSMYNNEQKSSKLIGGI